MEKYAWMAKIKPGMKDEYVRRHDEIWPELVALLKEAGICLSHTLGIGIALYLPLGISLLFIGFCSIFMLFKHLVILL